MRRFILTACLATIYFGATAEAADVRVEGTTFGGKPVLMIRAPASDALPPAVAASLERRISITWEGVAVADAIDELNQITGLPLVVAPELRADAQRAVNLTLDNVSVRSVLDWIETQTGVHVTSLHGGLYVSRDEPEAGTKTLIFDVSDLVHSIPDFPAPELALGGGGAEHRDFDIFDPGFGADDGGERYTVEDLAEFVERMLAAQR